MQQEAERNMQPKRSVCLLGCVLARRRPCHASGDTPSLARAEGRLSRAARGPSGAGWLHQLPPPEPGRSSRVWPGAGAPSIRAAPADADAALQPETVLDAVACVRGGRCCGRVSLARARAAVRARSGPAGRGAPPGASCRGGRSHCSARLCHTECEDAARLRANCGIKRCIEARACVGSRGLSAPRRV